MGFGIRNVLVSVFQGFMIYKGFYMICSWLNNSDVKIFWFICILVLF